MHMKVSIMRLDEDTPSSLFVRRCLNGKTFLFTSNRLPKMSTPSFSLIQLETINYDHYIILYDK